MAFEIAQPINPNYAGNFASIGKAFQGATSAIGQAPIVNTEYDMYMDKVAQIRDLEKNLKQTKEKAKSEIAALMGQYKYNPGEIEAAMKNIDAQEDFGELSTKYMYFMRNIQAMDEKKIPRKPMFGERDYETNMATYMEKMAERTRSDEGLKAVQEKLATLGSDASRETAVQAITSTPGFKNVEQKTLDFIAKGYPEEDAIKMARFEIDKIKLGLAIEKAKNDAARSKQRVSKDVIDGLNIQFDNVAADILAMDKDIKDKEAQIKKMRDESTVPDEAVITKIENEIFVKRARKKRITADLDGLQSAINDVNIGRTSGILSRRQTNPVSQGTPDMGYKPQGGATITKPSINSFDLDLGKEKKRK